MLSPAERSIRGRIGAYSLHAQYDSRELTKNARQAFDRKFLNEVDPDRILPENERHRRARAARQAYYARLARARRLRS